MPLNLSCLRRAIKLFVWLEIKVTSQSKEKFFRNSKLKFLDETIDLLTPRRRRSPTTCGPPCCARRHRVSKPPPRLGGYRMNHGFQPLVFSRDFYFRHIRTAAPETGALRHKEFRICDLRFTCPFGRSAFKASGSAFDVPCSMFCAPVVNNFVSLRAIRVSSFRDPQSNDGRNSSWKNRPECITKHT
jgi:hypothetical protein